MIAKKIARLLIFGYFVTFLTTYALPWLKEAWSYYHFKQKLHQDIEQQHLVFFTYENLKNTKWDKDYEFEWHEEKYDVVKKTALGYYCIEDKWEKKAEKELSDFYEYLSKNQDHNQNQNLGRWLPLLYFQHIHVFNFSYFGIKLDKLFCAFENQYHFELTLEILRPPNTLA